MLLQGYDVLFYGDSITMRWRSDWPRNRWGGPPPANSSGGTPMGVFNATFRVNYTSDVMGIGSEALNTLSSAAAAILVEHSTSSMLAERSVTFCAVACETLPIKVWQTGLMRTVLQKVPCTCTSAAR